MTLCEKIYAMLEIEDIVQAEELIRNSNLLSDDEFPEEDRMQTSYMLAKLFFKKGKLEKSLEWGFISQKFSEKSVNYVHYSNVLTHLGWVYLYKSEYNNAYDYFQQQLLHAEKHNNISLVEKYYINMGSFYKYMSVFDKAISSFDKGLEINEKTQDFENRIAILIGKGNCCHSSSFYEQSLQAYQEALSLSERLDKKKNIADCLSNIGLLYKDQNKYSHALEYYYKSLYLTEEIGETYSALITKTNIGNIYTNMQDYTQALKIHKEVYEYCVENTIKKGIAKSLNNIGNIYYYQGLVTEALSYYEQALVLFKELSDIHEIVAVQGNIASIHGVESNENSNAHYAIELRKETLNYVIKLHNPYKESIEHFALSQLYEQIQNWELANIHLKEYYRLQQITFDEDVKSRFHSFTLERQIAEKEQQRVLAEKESEIAQLYYEKQKQENELLKQDLMHKERELTAMIERLVQKSQFITTISKKLEEIAELNRNESKREIYHLIEILESRSIDESERSVMFLQLQSVYGDFMKILGERYSSLQEKEIMTCALLKMKLPSSKIAIMLGVSDRSVEKYRGNIRKKLGLPAGASIEIFLEKFYDKE